MNDLGSDSLRQRIEAAQARQRARDLAQAATGTARDRLTSAARGHPLLLIAGGLAIGVALSALVPRSPTRRLSRNAIGFLAMLTELGVSYGRQAVENGSRDSKASRERLAELGNTLIDGALRLRERIGARPAPAPPAPEPTEAVKTMGG